MTLPCPVCATPLDGSGAGAWRCPSCAGAFVSDAALRARLEAMAGRPVGPLGGGSHDGPARRCPHCAAVMRRSRLATVPIDRCDDHGFWFDPDELAQVLAAAGDDGVRARAGEDRARGRDSVEGVVDWLVHLLT